MLELTGIIGMFVFMFCCMLLVLSLLLPIFVMVIMFRLGDIRETLFSIEENL